MKNITRERLLDLTSQLEGIVRELLESTDTPSPAPRKRRNLKDQRVAKHFNKIQKRIKR